MFLRMSGVRRGLLAGILAVPASWLLAQSGQDTLKGRLQRAENLTSLDDAGSKPWHMKMNVQFYDLYRSDGKPKEIGTIEEWWSGPESYRVVYSFSSYSNIEVRTHDGRYVALTSVKAPYYADLLLRQIVHPVRAKSLLPGSQIEVTSRKSATGDLDLLTVYPRSLDPIDSATYDLSTYCFEKGKDVLVMSSEFPSETVQRAKFGRFLGQSVALAVIVQVGEKIVAGAQLVELKGQSTPYPETEDLSGLLKVAPVDGPIQAGRIIKKVLPTYPSVARAGHIQGTVVLSALIDETGRIKSLEVISSPAENLSKAALEAVQQWTYSPYIANGIATDVETTIRINFNLDRP